MKRLLKKLSSDWDWDWAWAWAWAWDLGLGLGTGDGNWEWEINGKMEKGKWEIESTPIPSPRR